MSQERIQEKKVTGEDGQQERSTLQLVRDIAGDTATLVRKEVELARQETRDRLDAELRELEQRMPQPAVWAKRAVGFLVGGGTAATLGLLLLRRRKKKRKREEARPVQAVIQVLPDRFAEQLSEHLSDG